MISDQIQQAINLRKDIRIVYTKYNGETSSRRVSNIQYSNEFVSYGYHNNHIVGYCHKRNENRTFKISRIRSVELLPTSSPTLSTSTHKPVTAQLSSGSSGCYIATMVYGNYDHPQVLKLRQFRDGKLSKFQFGKIFIKVYYSTSPTFVRLFKNNKLVNRTIKHILDKIINKLNN